MRWLSVRVRAKQPLGLEPMFSVAVGLAALF
jgi:hypothetical protein